MRLLSILYDVLHAIMDVLCDKINLFCFRGSYLHVIIYTSAEIEQLMHFFPGHF